MTSRFVMPFADVGSGIKPSSSAQLFFFETDGTTPKNTYTTKAATVANANPVIADSNGVFPAIYISGDYLMVSNLAKKIKSKNPNVHIVIDGVQAIGQLQINGLLNYIDIYIGCGHKWLGSTISSSCNLANSSAPFPESITCSELIITSSSDFRYVHIVSPSEITI